METIKNRDKIVIEYTCIDQIEKQGFISAYEELSKFYGAPIGQLSAEPDNPEDMLIVFSAPLSAILGIYFYMGAIY